MKNYLDMNYEDLIKERIENIKSTNEKDTFLVALWNEFSNVPVDEDTDTIDDDFYLWDRGTDKMDIWHWFDNHHSLGLAIGLMGF